MNDYKGELWSFSVDIYKMGMTTALNAMVIVLVGAIVTILALFFLFDRVPDKYNAEPIQDPVIKSSWAVGYADMDIYKELTSLARDGNEKKFCDRLGMCFLMKECTLFHKGEHVIVVDNLPLDLIRVRVKRSGSNKSYIVDKDKLN